ncbi:MAG: HIT family protein [Patescibacteria group bacterium]
MEKTLFEKIADREIPADIVYEDEWTLAFLDIKPVNPGHTLVITKKAYKNLLEVPPPDLHHLIETAQIVARGVKDAMNADGVNVSFNNEKAAGQLIFHVHAHIIPRFEEDGFKGWNQSDYKEGEKAEVAEKIIAQMQK